MDRGWFREACLRLSEGRTHYYLQCTTGKDKKQVSFLSNNNVGQSDDLTVQRHVRGKRTRDTIVAPQEQADYVANYKSTNNINMAVVSIDQFETYEATCRWNHLKSQYLTIDPRPPPVVPSALAPTPREMQDTGDIEGVTLPAPSMSAFSTPVDVCGALKRAASLVKAQKTKNASNKNNERTSRLQARSSSSSRGSNPRLMAWP